jgi:hypothetical protein
MEDLGSRIKQVTNELKDYVETRLELTFLNVGDKFTYFIGHSIQTMIGYVILGIGLLFMMTALAIYLGELLDARWAGYLIVAFPFILIGLIFVLGKPKFIARRIQSEMLAELLGSMNAEEEVDKLPSNKIAKKESQENG